MWLFSIAPFFKVSSGLHFLVSKLTNIYLWPLSRTSHVFVLQQLNYIIDVATIYSQFLFSKKYDVFSAVAKVTHKR
jgi:hypothetical protein